MVIAGTLPPIRGLFLFPAQLIAAMAAAGLVQAMTPGDIGATNTTLSPGTSVAQGVFIEMFMTAELVFVVLMLAAEKSKDTFLAPIGIGLALFVAMMGGKLFCSQNRLYMLTPMQESITLEVHLTLLVVSALLSPPLNFLPTIGSTGSVPSSVPL
jgi:hypothetical protein